MESKKVYDGIVVDYYWDVDYDSLVSAFGCDLGLRSARVIWYDDEELYHEKVFKELDSYEVNQNFEMMELVFVNEDGIYKRWASDLVDRNNMLLFKLLSHYYSVVINRAYINSDEAIKQLKKVKGLIKALSRHLCVSDNVENTKMSS